MGGYEKLPHPNGQQTYNNSRRSLRTVLFLLCSLIAAYWFLGPSDLNIRSPVLSGKKRVPMEIHIMSKCPDARDCLKQLIIPTMESVAGKVDFTMSYIGKSMGDDGVQCMHGETECLGNIVELCAAHLYPDPKIYLGFSMCLSNQYEKIPQEELVETCALEHSVDFHKLNGCMSKDDGQFGLDMLRSSFNRSQSVNATKSCTVRLNDELWCIRDGGEWKDCETDGGKPKTLIKQIKGLYNNSTARRM